MVLRIICLYCCLALAGCAAGLEHARTLAKQHGWRTETLQIEQWKLLAFLGPGQSTDLTVYIAGDGRAWPAPHTPPKDPTPDNPIALRMALQDPGQAVACLARPCQYVTSPLCAPRYWTDGRYSAEVLHILDTALDQLKNLYAAQRLRLVGYSGGGALAVLLGSQRTDVQGVVTAAAPLDTDAWTRLQGISPLLTSLNPAQHADPCLPQVHFFSVDDAVVPTPTGNAYMATLPAWSRAKRIVVHGVRHGEDWAERWETLLPTASAKLQELLNPHSHDRSHGQFAPKKK